MMPRLTLLFLLFGLANTFGNDSRIISTGNTSIELVKDTSIQIKSERLQFHLHDDSYSVVVEYEYYNDGPDVLVEIAFPIYTKKLGYDSQEIMISDFSTVFNREKIDKYDIIETKKEDRSYIESTIWFKRRVLFVTGINNSTISYSCKYSNSGFDQSFTYILGSAITWKSPIEKLEIDFHVDSDVIIKYWNIIDYDGPSGTLSA